MGYLEPIFDGVTDPTDPSYVDPYQKALTGIQETVAEKNTNTDDIYTIDGIKVDSKNLKPGLYITAGKKIVKR